MRIAAIADIHGNLPAFEAVLEAMPPVDAIVCAGDIVGYYPWPSAVIELIRDRNIPTVQGNHDRAVASETGFRFNAMASAGVEYALDQLSESQRNWLATLPTTRSACDGKVVIAHGHPDDPDRYTYPEDFSADLLGDESLLVLGHTHVQGSVVLPDGMIVNPGSVGQPRDGRPGAAFSIVDLGRQTVSEQRVDYNIDRVVDAVASANLPPELGQRLKNGR